VSTPSKWYRLRKFVRRNRAQSIAVAIAGAGLLVAFAMMWSALGIANASAEEAQRLRKLSDEKADSAYLLLANEERLASATAAERALPPPWPEHAAAYEQWLAEHGLPLEREREKLRQSLRKLEDQMATQAPETDDVSRRQRHLASALARLDGELAAFHGEHGLLREVQRRQRLMADVIAPAAAMHEQEWNAAIAAIAHSDGTTACREYRGLRVPALAGLVPLGADPKTKLHEFLDLASHQPGYPLPARDEATGQLRTDAGTGIVFVLVPGGRLEQGARQNRPGVDRNDELAEGDELRGTSVALDAFLIGRTELTLAQWSRLAGLSPLGDDPQLPATNIDWPTASYVLSRFGMGLPTEAQWEYACRANSGHPWSTGPRIEDAAAAAGWFKGLQPVGLLSPNAFGLFDVHGNAAEWCEDEKLPYEDSAPRSGDGLRERAVPRRGDEQRVVRGGAWHQGPEHARTTARDGRPPAVRDAAIGMRPVRSLRSSR